MFCIIQTDETTLSNGKYSAKIIISPEENVTIICNAENRLGKESHSLNISASKYLVTPLVSTLSLTHVDALLCFTLIQCGVTKCASVIPFSCQHASPTLLHHNINIFLPLIQPIVWHWMHGWKDGTIFYWSKESKIGKWQLTSELNCCRKKPKGISEA